MNRKVIAKELLRIAKNLVAIDFPNREALRKYLKEHPGAKMQLHRVVENHPDGTKSQTDFVNGKRHGGHSSWYPNGQMKAIGWFSKGNPHGNFHMWHPNGAKADELTFRRGKPLKRKEWDEKGNILKNDDFMKNPIKKRRDRDKTADAKNLLVIAKQVFSMVNETSYVEHGVEVKLSETNGKFYAKFTNAKTGKLLKYYSFRREENRAAYVKDFMEEVKRRIKSKQDRKLQRAEERKNFVNPYKVGDIFYSSWGYDQTNISWFKVVKVLDKSVYLVELASKDSSKRDHVLPSDKSTGIAMRRLVDSNGGVQIKSYMYAQKWDGQPRYETPAGMGH